MGDEQSRVRGNNAQQVKFSLGGIRGGTAGQ